MHVRRVLGIGVLGLVEAVHAAVGGTALALPRVLESDSGDQRGGEPREERKLFRRSTRRRRFLGGG